MEKIKLDIDEIKLIKKQLESEHVEKIDFDKLCVQLEMVNTLYESYHLIQNEFQVLNQNLINKITLMEKAIQAVTKKRTNLDELANKFEELAQMNSSELVKTFDKTETKFHASFPSTFCIDTHNKNKIRSYKSYK